MLDAASEVFMERGFEGASVAEVVRRSGGSLATLYAQFGSKEGLFEAILQEVSAQILAPLDAPEFESRPLAEALCLFGERFLGMVLCPDALRWQRMCVVEGPKHPELRQALLRTGPGRVQERLATYLAAQAEAGRLAVDDPVTAAQHYFSLIKSEYHLAAVCGEPMEISIAEVARQVERAVNVFLHGYAVREAGSPVRRPRPTTRASQHLSVNPRSSRSQR